LAVIAETSGNRRETDRETRLNRWPAVLLVLTLAACAEPEPAREPPAEEVLWKRLENREFPVCERDFRDPRDRHECMIDSAWLVWTEAGLEWDLDMQGWSHALLARTYALEQRARRLERGQDQASAGELDAAQWERIRRAGDLAIEQMRQGQSRDWQAGYDQGFDDALPPVEDFNETFGGWDEPPQD
jgi:hypothetical protein